MSVENLIGVVLPFFVAIGAAMLVWIFMEARMETAIAKERTALAEANNIISNHNSAWSDKVKAIEETARRKALDEMLHEIRTEERRYLRRGRTAQGGASLIVQERMCFRGIPLTPWTERTISAERGEELLALPPGLSLGEPQPMLAEVVPIAAPSLRFEQHFERNQKHEGPVDPAEGQLRQVYNNARAEVSADEEADRDEQREADVDVAIPVVFESAEQADWGNQGGKAGPGGFPFLHFQDVEESGDDDQAAADPKHSSEDAGQESDRQQPESNHTSQRVAEA